MEAMGSKTGEEICNVKFVNDTLTFKRSNQSPCKCEGTLSPWSGWSQCSATCGEGTQQRQRRCIGPGDCDGVLIDEEPCQDQPNCFGNFFFVIHTKLDFSKVRLFCLV